jgi:bifunctional DNA-binding transcriptional regulator/antitoxin component of YhaV-PrlF toxin-antitoxin module
MKIDLDNVVCIKEAGITIRGSRRRVTVPSEIVDILKLKDKDKIKWIAMKDGTILIHSKKTRK